MIFHKTTLEGLYIIEPELRTDMRGYFTRVFCKDELAKTGLNFDIVQASRSYTKSRGMLRGLHCQRPPKAEDKMIQCFRGAAFFVAVDVRRDSPTFSKWESFELNEENKKIIFIPKGFANGFQALSDNVELLYFMSQFFSPEHDSGVRWNDPKLNIPWPIPNPVLSEKDQNLQYLS